MTIELSQKAANTLHQGTTSTIHQLLKINSKSQKRRTQ